MMELHLNKVGDVTVHVNSSTVYYLTLKEPLNKILYTLATSYRNPFGVYEYTPVDQLMTAIGETNKLKFTKYVSTLRTTLGLGKTHLPCETSEGFRLRNVKCEIIK